MVKELQEEWYIFKKYVWKNRWYIIISSILFLFVYCTWIFNINPRIDTEVLINNPGTTTGWLTIGRQGGIFTEFLFGLRWFNPFVSTAFGFLLLNVAGILCGYIFWRIGDVNNIFSVCFGLIYFSSPIFVETLYFDMMIFKIAWAYILCIVAVGLSYFGILRKMGIVQVISIICLIWAISTYQVFAIVYITLVIICFILFCYKHLTCQLESISFKYYVVIVLKLIIILVIAMLLNSIITKLFFWKSTYLENQIFWGVLPIEQCLNNVFFHFLQSFFGIGTFYTSFYGVLSLGTIISLFLYTWKNKKNMNYWLLLMAGIVLQLTPYLLTIYLGNIPSIRAQLIYPLVITGNIVILSCFKWKRIWLKIGLALIVSLLIWSQIQTTMRLIYTDEIRAREDLNTATMIYGEIQQKPLQKNKKLAFVGTNSNELNNACLRGELIGASIFSWDSEVVPHYLNSTNRIVEICKTLGYSNYEIVSEQQMLEARKLALDMPSWPQDGSIVETEDYVVIKLGPDRWPEEILEPIFSKVELEKVEVDESIKYAIDNFSVENNKILVHGWAIKEGVKSSEIKPHIYLKNNKTEEYYEMNTIHIERPDLVNALENGEIYRYGGFVSIAPFSEIEKNFGLYSLYIGIEKDGNVYIKNILENLLDIKQK